MGTPLIDYLGILMTPAGTPQTGDMPTRGVSGGWTTVQSSLANLNSQLHYDTPSGLPAWKGGAVTALPTPDSTLQGVICTLAGGSGVADIAYICLKGAGGSYSWKELVSG